MTAWLSATPARPASTTFAVVAGLLALVVLSLVGREIVRQAGRPSRALTALSGVALAGFAATSAWRFLTLA